MDPGIHAALARWGNFYLITGTAAAALTALQFVVQTLLASNTHRNMAGADPEGGISAFATPTVVHFTVALLVSCVLAAPWSTAAGLGAALVAFGAVALGYSAVVLRRTRRQHGYVPQMEIGSGTSFCPARRTRPSPPPACG
jgi:hypothetical protein